MAQEFGFDVDTDRKLNSDRFPATEQDEQAQFNEQVPREGPTPEPDEADVAAELSKLRSKLGEQGAQMGALKERANAADTLRSEVDAMRAENAQMKAAAAQQQQGYGNADIFSDIGADQTFQSPMERQRINQLAVATAQTIGQQNEIIEGLKNAVNVMQQAQYRTATGLSDAEEAQLSQENPWLNTLPVNEKAQAIASLVSNRQVAPQQAANEQARNAARAASHTESGNAPTGGPDVNPAGEKLLRDFRSGKYDNAESMRKAMRKIGIGSVDDTGRPY